MTQATTVTVEIGGRTYEAGIIGDTVTILRDGVQVGQGGWDGEQIADCDADLGDDVYEALDEALVEVVTRVDQAADLRARREAAGLTQQQLADRLGVARPRIAEWESGTRNPSAAAMRGIDAALADPRAVYVVGSDAWDLEGWTPETLAAALVAPLGAINVAVVCLPRVSGSGLGLDGLPAALRKAAQAIVERVVADGP